MVILMHIEYFAPRALRDVFVLISENDNPHRYKIMQDKAALLLIFPSYM